MAGNRERLLAVYDILQRETDEETEYSLEEIIQKLKEKFGETFTVKKEILRKDLQALDETILPIVVNSGPHGKKYYSHQERLFELSELRMLMDACVSAQFLTKKETENLIKKIKKLTSRRQAGQLPHEQFAGMMVKSKNTYLKYDIDRLHRAFCENKKIAFQYGTYTVEKDFQLHRNGEFYSVKPYALIWHNNFYYLIGEYEKLDEIRHYRVDRMRNVRVVEEQVGYVREKIDIGEYMQRTFHMFASPDVERIELLVDNDLFNAMIDRFGLEQNYEKKGENQFIVRAEAAVNDGLIAWLLNWGSKVKVLSPPGLVQRMKEEAEKLYEIYHEKKV